MASLLDLYRSVFGGESDQGAPMAAQNRQGGFDPYTPAPVPDALELLKSLTGYTDLEQAGQAYGRGEYLPALGQGAWGAAQAATMAYPALKAGGAALRAGAPLAREAAAAMPGLLADETGAIRAYHGSPHSFDRFDISKIGTGEGAQAYGHGLYFAEAEDVARGYRDTLAGKAPLREYGGQPLETRRDWFSLIDRVEPQDWRLAQIIDAAGKQGRIRTALDTFEPHTRNASDGPLWAAAIEKFKEGVGPAAKGHMYEVDIHADPKAFLDWDRPLSAQPQSIRDLMASNRIPEVLTEYQHSWPGRGDMPVTGADAYNRLAGRALAEAPGATKGYMPPPGFNPRVVASEELKAGGIPGIRYLDQGSRGAGEGTSNFAIFDDTIIEILRKYGILPPVAAGGLLATQEEP